MYQHHLKLIKKITFVKGIKLRKEKVVKRKVSTVMRDGTILPADLYLPDATGPFPTVVERTPHYKERDFSPPLFRYLTERG